LLFTRFPVWKELLIECAHARLNCKHAHDDDELIKPLVANFAEEMEKVKIVLRNKIKQQKRSISSTVAEEWGTRRASISVLSAPSRGSDDGSSQTSSLASTSTKKAAKLGRFASEKMSSFLKSGDSKPFSAVQRPRNASPLGVQMSLLDPGHKISSTSRYKLDEINELTIDLRRPDKERESGLNPYRHRNRHENNSLSSSGLSSGRSLGAEVLTAEPFSPRGFLDFPDLSEEDYSEAENDTAEPEEQERASVLQAVLQKKGSLAVVEVESEQPYAIGLGPDDPSVKSATAAVPAVNISKTDTATPVIEQSKTTNSQALSSASAPQTALFSLPLSPTSVADSAPVSCSPTNLSLFTRGSVSPARRRGSTRNTFASKAPCLVQDTSEVLRGVSISLSSTATKPADTIASPKSTKKANSDHYRYSEAPVDSSSPRTASITWHSSSPKPNHQTLFDFKDFSERLPLSCRKSQT